MKDSETIILVSDNHGETSGLEYVRNTHWGADIFVHCGDAELPTYLLDGFLVVQGNNDAWQQFPMRRVIEVQGHRIYICHGHRDLFYGRFEMLADKARDFDCDIAFFGHSHVPFDKTVKGVRLLNPGSIWRNRDGSQPSYMVVTLRKGEIEVRRMTYVKNKSAS